MNNIILNIEVLALFFYNYSQNDIQELCQEFEFKHFWESKRFSFSDNTNIQMWMGFVNYFSDSTKVIIYELASKRYRKEAKRRKNI